MTSSRPDLSYSQIASYIITISLLFVICSYGLLAALLSGLLVHETVLLVAPWLGRQTRTNNEVGKAVALVVIIGLISLAITGAVIGLSTFLTSGQQSVVALITKMTDVIEQIRTYLPDWAVHYIPKGTEGLQASAVDLLKSHAWELQKIGQDVGRTLIHVLIGMIIGGLVLFSRRNVGQESRPLAAALQERVQRLAMSFRRVVFAQIRISALNTLLTGIYLAVILPQFGIHLPLVKTMIAVTFIVGLMPVIGNIISNTVIVIIGLSVSPLAAFASLGYLVAIHKLEYFLNARIIGSQINAKAYELLTTMLIMEVLFGIPGVVAAPIFYALLKDELRARALI